MIDEEMVRYLAEQLEAFAPEQLRAHLVKEGQDPAIVDASLREAQVRRAGGVRTRKPAPTTRFKAISKTKSRRSPLLVYWAFAFLALLAFGIWSVVSRGKKPAPTLERAADEPPVPVEEEGPTVVAPRFQDTLDKARAGDPEAQHTLGVLYERGALGMKRDPRLARKWLLKAAKQGHTDAQFRTGRLLASGSGGSTDFLTASKWYQAAAEQGHVEAQVNLGLLYAEGRLGPPDREAALPWWNLALARGSPRAMLAIGEGFSGGAPRSKELAACHKWNTMALLQARRRGDSETERKAETMVRKLQGYLTPKQVERAVRRAQAELATLP